MNFERYLEEVIASIETKMVRQDITVSTATKVSGTSLLTGVVIKNANSNIAPTIYLNEMFEEGYSVDEATEKVVEIYKNYKVTSDIDIDFFSDFEEVKKIVLFKLLPLKSALMMADNSDVVFITAFDNLAKVYYVPVNSDITGLGSITVTRSHIDVWNVTLEELDRFATNNVAMSNIAVQTMDEIFGPIMSGMPMVVVSNENKMYGASQIFNRKALNKALDKIGANEGIILPSSIHEFIVIPTDLGDNTDSLIDLVKYVNTTELSEDEILTDDIFSYKRNTEVVKISA